VAAPFYEPRVYPSSFFLGYTYIPTHLDSPSRLCIEAIASIPSLRYLAPLWLALTTHPLR
jgi:hypothetical protein